MVALLGELCSRDTVAQIDSAVMTHQFLIRYMVKRTIYSYAFKYISYCYKISYSIIYVYEASVVYYVSPFA